ncbi:MAG: hypothetical protein ACOC3I_04330 [Verrucomicrobiota bacterium]
MEVDLIEPPVEDHPSSLASASAHEAPKPRLLLKRQREAAARTSAGHEPDTRSHEPAHEDRPEAPTPFLVEDGPLDARDEPTKAVTAPGSPERSPSDSPPPLPAGPAGLSEDLAPLHDEVFLPEPVAEPPPVEATADVVERPPPLPPPPERPPERAVGPRPLPLISFALVLLGTMGGAGWLIVHLLRHDAGDPSPAAPALTVTTPNASPEDPLEVSAPAPIVEEAEPALSQESVEPPAPATANPTSVSSPAPPPRAAPTPKIAAFVDQLTINLVRNRGADSMIVVGGVVYRLNDLVHPGHGLRFIGFTAEGKGIVFEDAGGARYARKW